jgi:hypothetical protein
MSSRRYGTEHRKLRERWRPRVEAGDVLCARCGLPIVGQWDLAHDPMDGTRYLGPMCQAHNRDTRLEKRLRGNVRGGPPRWRSDRW